MFQQKEDPTIKDFYNQLGKMCDSIIYSIQKI